MRGVSFRRPLRPTRCLSDATEYGAPICPTIFTLPISMPISSVLEQNVVAGNPL